MAHLRWISLLAAPFAVASSLALWSCGGGWLCGRSARSDCPCMPGYDEGYDTAGSHADEGCGRSAEFRCACGMPPDEGGEATSGTTTDTTTGETCDDQTPVTLYLSADDSNSMSSPVQVRAAVLGGWNSITALAIRPWEFFNYYDFAYPAAPAGEVAVTAELGLLHDAPDEYALQIGVSSPTVHLEDRPPVSLTFVLDTSGSMTGIPLALSQDVCRAVAASLREGDRVSMVTWNTENTVILDAHTVAGPDDPTLLAAIDALTAGGATDLHSGLVAGYELAEKTALPGRVNRMILISDGGANTGVTDIDLIAAHAGAEDEDGIYMVGVGVGSATTYHDTLMDSVTDAGKGASVFIPDPTEAWRMFHTRFVNTLMVAARDVQVRVDLPPGFAIKRFSGEEYSTDPAEVEPQHLAPNDAMVFHQRVTTCAPELIGPDSTLTVTARYLDAVTFLPHEVSVTLSFPELLAAASPRLEKGKAMMAYTDALTELRVQSPEAPAKIAEALVALDAADAALPGDPDLAELRAVLQAL